MYLLCFALAISFLGLGFWFLRQLRSRVEVVFITVSGKRLVNMQVTDMQQVSCSLAGQDAVGNPAPLTPDTTPVWNLSDATFGNVQPEADGLSALFIPSGKLGSVDVQVSLAIGGKQFAGSGTLVVVAGSATKVSVVFGTPQNIPTSPTP